MKRTFTKTYLTRLFCGFAVASFALQSCTTDEPTNPSVDVDVNKPGAIEPEGELFSELFPEENDEIRYTDSGIVDYNVTVYVNSESGNDGNDGLSVDAPIATLAKLQTILDNNTSKSIEVLLYGGAEGTLYKGMIELRSRTEPTHVGSYGDAKARIDAYGKAAGVYIYDSSNIIVSDLKITANGGCDSEPQTPEALKENRSGVEIRAVGNENITIENVDIRDVFYFDIDSSYIPDARNSSEWGEASDANYGWGFLVKGKLDKLTVLDCNVRNVSAIGYKMNSTAKGLKNLTIKGCTSYETGGAGAQFSHVDVGLMSDCKSVNSGSRKDHRNWGRGSGMWLVSSRNFIFEHNLYEGAQGIGDSCGAHIDIDNEGIIIQYCFSRDNSGGFCEVLGGSKNCAYRYNISINDGWRNPNDWAQYPLYGWLPDNVQGVNGCIVTVNGTHSGDRWLDHGPYNTYVYNNTIINTGFDRRGYVNPLVFEIATSVRGLFMANNIFWMPKRMTVHSGSHEFVNGQCDDSAYDFRISTGLNNQGYANVRDMNEEELAMMDVQILNNLYKFEDTLPAIEGNQTTPSYWDENPIVADPYFGDENAWEAENLIPRNSEVINQGVAIEKLLSDTSESGLFTGLEMSKDFFGNPITTPIIGACVAR